MLPRLHRKVPVASGKPATGLRQKAGATFSSLAHDPVVRMLVADIVLRGGAYLMQRGVQRQLAGEEAADADQGAETADKGTKDGGKPGKRHRRRLRERVVTAAASAIAARSVPGAAMVGAGMVAHNLYLRGKARRARRAAAGEPQD